MRWDEWKGSLDGRPAMYIKRLFKLGGYSAELHKFVRPDDKGCFHTHSSYAVRIILWGGYFEEEVLSSGCAVEWKPLRVGAVSPDYCHRVSALRGKVSYSLWLKGPKVKDALRVGSGWPDAL